MLNIFNSFTQKHEILKLNTDKIIKMYVCGVTSYDFCHIGHGRTFIFFDIVLRYLRYCGYKLQYVRNITDIDDKIIAKSIENNETIFSLSNRMIDQMNKDFLNLNIVSPDYEPRATENIDIIIQFILQLLNSKHAYVSNCGDVMFSIDTYLNYGLLSNQLIDNLKIGVRISKNLNKRNPSDFVLWKLLKKHETFCWNSPWGKGRPGWHIECSSMSSSILKDRIDIHGGGKDLLFPHHENELAQSTCINKKFFVNHWMHTELVIVKNKKMSKSLGNALLLKDLLVRYDSESIRFFLLSTHYRHPLYFYEENLKKSEILLKKLYFSLRNIDFTMFNSLNLTNYCSYSLFKLDFCKALNNDFNTPVALSILLKMSHRINILKLKCSDRNDNNEIIVLAYRLRELGNILGILFQDPEYFFQKIDKFSSDEISNINLLIQKRDNARKIKNWIKADKIRNNLLNLGIVLEDSKYNTFWRKLK
ncbi:MAG: cysteine--tRNA ligase [Buchnera aphidicola (Floraphis choui)]